MGIFIALLVWGLGMIPAADRFKDRFGKPEGEDAGEDANDAHETLYWAAVVLWPVLVLVPLCRQIFRLLKELAD